MSETESPEIEIARLPKNKREELVLTLSEFNGFRMLHCRIWVRNEGGAGIPTKSGFAIQVSHLTALCGALRLAEREAVALGWIAGRG